MSKHAFRPLKVDYGYADYLAISTSDDELVMVAAIDIDEHGAEPTSEQVAYARLFAESPALLEALEWLVRLDGEMYYAGQEPDEWHDAFSFAKEKIAKVKGESSES